VACDGHAADNFFRVRAIPDAACVEDVCSKKKIVSFKVADVVSFVASALPDRLAFSPRRPAGSEYATALPK
jgi:hypothetical protein